MIFLINERENIALFFPKKLCFKNIDFRNYCCIFATCEAGTKNITIISIIYNFKTTIFNVIVYFFSYFLHLLSPIATVIWYILHNINNLFYTIPISVFWENNYISCKLIYLNTVLHRNKFVCVLSY